MIFFCQLILSSAKEIEVIFHKRVRVFYQGLQTREDNEFLLFSSVCNPW